MNTRFTKVLMLGTVAGLFVTASAMAGESYLDASSKMRGEFGQTSRRATEYRPMYRASAPTLAQQQPAPNAEQRFSYEPRQIAGDSRSSASDSANKNAPNATAQRDTRTYRSFSYEPGTAPSAAMRSRSNSTPLYALPKSDPRKVGGGW